MPADDLQAKLGNVGFPLNAVVDGDLVKTIPTLTSLADAAHIDSLFPGISWCKTIMMGDCQMDGMIIGLALAHRTDNLASSLKKALEAVFPDDPSKVAAVLRGYGVDESKDDRLPILQFINDIAFFHGAKATAEAWAGAAPRLGTRAFLMHFNLPNPWAGPWQGHASHALDAAIVLGNYNAYLGEGQRACAEKMAGDLISFVNGGQPFPPYSGGQGKTAMVYYAGADSKEDGSRAVDASDESKTGRRGILEAVADGQPAVMDKLLGAFGLLVQGPK